MKSSKLHYSIGLFFTSFFLSVSVELHSQDLFFENQNRETAYSEYLEIREDRDRNKYLKIKENTPRHFSYILEAWPYFKYEYNFYFNENGQLISNDILTYFPSQEKTREAYNDEKLRLYSLDNNPNNIGEYSHKGVKIYDTEVYRILFHDEPAELRLGLYYSKEANFKAQIYTPKEKTYRNTVKTTFGPIDFKSEEMVNDIRNYIVIWQIMVSNPNLSFFKYIFQEEVDDVVAIKKGKLKKGRWNLNSNVRHRLNQFQSTHAENCEYDIKREIEFDKDEWSENQIVCGKDFVPFEYKVEYGDLEGNTLAVAIGNIFDNEEIRIIIDPLKFKNASPAKRAFIIYHELFHTLKIEHGECGPLMFPYADQEVTWYDWEKGTVDALRCFYQKVAYK